MDFPTLLLDQVLQPSFYYSVILSVISFIVISLLANINGMLGSRLKSIAYLVPFVFPLIIIFLYPPITSIAVFDPSKLLPSGSITFLQPQFQLPFLHHFYPPWASLGPMIVNTLPIDHLLSITGVLCLAGLVFCVAWLLLSVTLGSQLTWRMLRVVELGPDDYPDLQVSTLELAKDMRISRPRFGLVEDLRPNAFVFGTNKRPVIVLSLGLIKLLDDDEVMAVVAHELAHIKHRDTRFRTIACALGWLSFFNPLALVALRMARRERERMADDAASVVLGDEAPLVKAIKKVSSALSKSGSKPLHGVGQGFFLVSSLSERISLFSTHPSVTDRVKSIRKEPRKKPTALPLAACLILSLLVIVAAGMVTISLEHFREESIMGSLNPMSAGPEGNAFHLGVPLYGTSQAYQAPHDLVLVSPSLTNPPNVLENQPMPLIAPVHQL